MDHMCVYTWRGKQAALSTSRVFLSMLVESPDLSCITSRLRGSGLRKAAEKKKIKKEIGFGGRSWTLWIWKSGNLGSTAACGSHISR